MFFEIEIFGKCLEFTTVQIFLNFLNCKVLDLYKLDIFGIFGMGHVGYSNEWPILPAIPISPHPTL